MIRTRLSLNILALAALLAGLATTGSAQAATTCVFTNPDDFHTSGSKFTCFNNGVAEFGQGGGGEFTAPPSNTDPVTPPPASTGFSNIFLIDNDADHTGYTTVVRPLNHLPAGGEAPIGVTYPFPNAGTWYVAACADFDSSWVGTVAESNESNNCTAWTAMEVTSTFKPDVTAGAAVRLPSGLGGLLQAVITNQGNAGTSD